MPATSEPASGSVMAIEAICSPRMAGLHGDGHSQPSGASPRQLLGEHQRREVVAALAAVLRWVAQAQKTELPEALEDRVREGLFLPLIEVRLDFLFEEPADVQPELLVSVGEVHRQGV